MTATQAQLDQLFDVNQQDNEIPFVATPGPDEVADWWTDVPVPGKSWVCRMYTQRKADDLKALGWPASALTVILCYVETGEYHACLAVDDGTPGNPLILDSRFPQVYRKNQPPAAYRWALQQVAGTTDFVPVAQRGGADIKV